MARNLTEVCMDILRVCSIGPIRPTLITQKANINLYSNAGKRALKILTENNLLIFSDERYILTIEGKRILTQYASLFTLFKKMRTVVERIPTFEELVKDDMID